MDIKKLIIVTNDHLAYFAFALVGIAAFIFLLSAGLKTALIVGAAGWCICSVLFGFWFALSSLADESARQSEILNKMLGELRAKDE